MKDEGELKKRGKKVKDNKVFKKRGRKPKTDVSTVSVKGTSKKGRKSVKEKAYGVPGAGPISYGVTDTSSIEVVPEDVNTATPDESPSENIILHLPVHSDELERERTATGEEVPQEMETGGVFASNAKWIGGANVEGMSGACMSGSCMSGACISGTCGTGMSGACMGDSSGFAEYPFHKNEEIIEVLQEPTVGLESHTPWALRNDIKFQHMHNWNNAFRVDKAGPVEYNRKTDVLMKPFIEANNRGEWPKSTPIHCFWCCHPFENQPCALPVDFREDVYHVYGCFCSPECTAAYNFNDFADAENRWERYSLLNMMYKKLYANLSHKIKPAPPRQTLEIFGGPLSIGQFRQTLENYEKTYVVNMPPMTSIHAQQEQINFDSNQYGKRDSSLFIPVDHERVSEANENLKLKRKKPVSDAKNTLENCMNLQFR